MIKDKEIYFGYGSLLVSSISMRLIIKHVTPPQEVGTRYDPNIHKIDILSEVVIESSTDNFKKLIDQLEHIYEQEDKRIEFEGYILNFNDSKSTNEKDLIEFIEWAIRDIVIKY